MNKDRIAILALGEAIKQKNLIKETRNIGNRFEWKHHSFSKYKKENYH